MLFVKYSLNNSFLDHSPPPQAIEGAFAGFINIFIYWSNRSIPWHEDEEAAYYQIQLFFSTGRPFVFSFSKTERMIMTNKKQSIIYTRGLLLHINERTGRRFEISLISCELSQLRCTL